ncbi:unnamed protein product [Polarella glacialis]|uniref:Uncharacterized protein n=1 Tax=Polarella glacialis TaxID=89957 RepID=A0A813G4E0_POLGL|nr:unnamed protein product [Polarella glacialis]
MVDGHPPADLFVSLRLAPLLRACSCIFGHLCLPFQRGHPAPTSAGSVLSIACAMLDYRYPLQPTFGPMKSSANMVAWLSTMITSWERTSICALYVGMLLVFRSRGPQYRVCGMLLCATLCLQMPRCSNALLSVVVVISVWEKLHISQFGILYHKERNDLHLKLQHAWGHVAAAAGGELLMVSPNQVRFTHGSISFCFRNGDQLDSTISSMLAEDVLPEALPPLEVTLYQDNLYSLSNRRLFVLRVLANHGLIKDIPVVRYDFRSSRVQHKREGQSKWERAFSTKNAGISVEEGVCGACGQRHSSKFAPRQMSTSPWPPQPPAAMMKPMAGKAAQPTVRKGSRARSATRAGR